MENNETTKDKDARVNIRLPTYLHKALQYAKIEHEVSTESIVEEALKLHLIKLGFLKESGEIKKPEPIEV